MFRPAQKTDSRYLSIPGSGAAARERRKRVLSLVAAGFPLPEGRIFGLLRRLAEPVVDLRGVGDLLRSEPRLNGQILGLLHSSSLSEYRQPLAVDHAVVLLGAERLRILILGCALADFAGRRLPAETVRAFWHHGILAALLSERIAREARPGEAEKAYIAGLLHDVGRLPLLIVAREQQLSGAEIPPGVHDQPARERSYFGVDHCEVGRWIALSAGFPCWMTEVIAHHHQPSEAAENPALAALVAAADRHCRLPAEPEAPGSAANASREDGDEGLLRQRPSGLLRDHRAMQSRFLANSGLPTVFPRFASC